MDDLITWLFKNSNFEIWTKLPFFFCKYNSFFKVVLNKNIDFICEKKKDKRNKIFF